jgi:hypothetical protein
VKCQYKAFLDKSANSCSHCLNDYNRQAEIQFFAFSQEKRRRGRQREKEQDRARTETWMQRWAQIEAVREERLLPSDSFKHH